MRKSLISILTLALFIAVAFTMAGDKEVKHEYVGADKCKICHKKDGTYESWLTTKHATAFDGLSDADKKNPEFMKYYTTGTDAKGELLTGVQCEACHGAGADYKKKAIMENREEAIANGMIIPDENTCKGCHNEKAPGALGASAKEFDFAKMKVKGVHAMPVKEEKK
ncbi:MAG: multiheme c-type cytochrome [Candidatus Zixiibacteriota bacterium]